MSLDLDRLPDILVQRILVLQKAINCQHLGMGLWSIARLPPSIASLRQELQPALLSHCRDFLQNKNRTRDARYRLKAVSHVAWSLSLLDFKDKMMFDCISDTFVKEASDPQGTQLLCFIDVLCAYAKLQIVDEHLLEAAACLPWKLSKLRDWDVSALAWAYQELDPMEIHKAFQVNVRREIARRKLTEAQVMQSQHGYEEWYSGNSSTK